MMIKDFYYYQACEYAKGDYWLFNIRRTEAEVKEEAKRLREQVQAK